MPTTEVYRGHTIVWREMGERFCATIMGPDFPHTQWKPIFATVAEGMQVLKDRTKISIDEWCEDNPDLI